MEDNLNIKPTNKDRVIIFLEKYKYKIITLIIIFFLIVLVTSFLIYKKNLNNELLGEKYIQAGIYLTSEENEKSYEIYKDLIFKKHKFYSILALNTIVEKNLETDAEKILKYFEEVEKISIDKNQRELILFKKALYLLKNFNDNRGMDILKKIVESDSSFKFLAEDIINNK